MNVIRNNKLFFITNIALIVVVFFALGYFVFNGQDTNVSAKIHHQEYADNWTLRIGDGEETHPELPLRVKIPGKETATLTNTLPDSIPDGSAILCRNYHEILKAYVDDELIFSYPNEDWNHLANVISDEWCLVELKPEHAGRTIKLTYTNSTVFSFHSKIGDLYYGADDSLILFVKRSGLPGLVLGIIVGVIAFMLLVISYIYRNHTNQSTNTAMGLAFLCFSIWLMNRARMAIAPNYSLYLYWIALMCLLFVAPSIFLYSHFRNEKFKQLSIWGARICFVADIILIISSLFINYDIEIIVIFAYTLSLIALSLNAHSLFVGGFGKASKNRTNIEKLLDRTEFISNLIFPLIIILELTFYRDLLWTEASFCFRLLIAIYSITYMIFILWRTFLVVQDRTIVTKKLHDSQLELMMGQIQPHFIFNTLSSIRTLVMVDPKVAYNMLYDFSNYLRANIDNVTNMDGISFASEVNHIKSYVNIEKVRFGDKLEVEYDIQTDNFTVPPLSIQPLVENAIKHGVCKKIHGGTVILKSYEESDYNVVEVSDNGIGFNTKSASKVFATPTTSSAEESNTKKLIASLLSGISGSLILRDKNGDPIELVEQEINPDLTGNGSEKHNSKGMMNILLRLREMANAKVEIRSQEDMGTQIKVMFPKDYKPV